MVLDFSTDIFKVEQLTNSKKHNEQIRDFYVAKKTGKGLEYYLEHQALKDEFENSNRVWLVKDKFTDELAGYFALRNGDFTLKHIVNNETYTFAVPGIELSNFAVNSAYRDKHPDAKGLGTVIFKQFVVPTVKLAGEISAVQAIYIYSLPEEDLMNHYSDLGFSRLTEEEEKFIHENAKPSYDESCIFMYQIV